MKRKPKKQLQFVYIIVALAFLICIILVVDSAIRMITRANVTYVVSDGSFSTETNSNGIPEATDKPTEATKKNNNKNKDEEPTSTTQPVDPNYDTITLSDSDLHNGALDGYWNFNVAEPDKNYYKRVVTGAVRGVDFIASLPEWDGKTIGVTGASQGGFLSLAVAALDKRITFLGVVHDAMCDYEAELHNVGGGWPHTIYWDMKSGLDKNLINLKVEGGRYYDGVNFARRVTQPGWYSFGYNDEVVPPTSSYSTYNIVTAPKTLSVYQMTGHYWYQEQWDEWQDFLRKQMGL